MPPPTTARAALALALLPFAAPAPAQAATAPAYGTIRIADDGLGVRVVWTYDAVAWDCDTAVDGQFHAPAAVVVTCGRIGEVVRTPFACPLMVLTTRTSAPGARAGGRAGCTRTLDTGVLVGIDVATRSGDLGPADQVTCAAYVGSLALVPPYEVTCSEPGLPG